MNDAKINVGLLGGGNFTHWQHFVSSQASDWYLAAYKPTLRFGYFGGIAIEYMWKSDLSFGLNVIYEQHNIGLNYLNGTFPTALNHYIKRNYDFTANYNSIEAYIPVTFYMSTGSKNLKPYFFIAPRFAYILGGDMSYTRTDTDQSGQVINTLNSTAEFSETSYASYYGPINLFNNEYELNLGMLNIGLMAGVGTQFRFNTSNYYFLLKLDLSANVNGFQTFTKYDLANEFNHLRYSADAHLTATFMLPIKKRLIGACIRWGEYD